MFRNPRLAIYLTGIGVNYAKLFYFLLPAIACL